MTNIHERNIDGKTKLVGLLATPIGHSLSPRMHNLGYTLTGINYAYLAFEVGNDELEAAVYGMKAMEAAGFNVSMPNKMKVLDYLDELDDLQNTHVQVTPLSTRMASSSVTTQTVLDM